MEQLEHENKIELIATLTDKLATEALPKAYRSLTNMAGPAQEVSCWKPMA